MMDENENENENDNGREPTHEERMAIARRFVAWIVKQGSSMCECCADDYGMSFTRELAAIIAGLSESMSMEQIVVLFGIPIEAIEGDLGATQTEEARANLALLREVHELLPGSYERWRRWEADEEMLRPLRRRTRDLARELKAQRIKGEIDGVDIQKASVKRLAKVLRGAHQLAFARLMEQLGFIERTQGARN